MSLRTLLRPLIRRISAANRVLTGRPPRGPHWQFPGAAPNLHLVELSASVHIRKHLEDYLKGDNDRKISFLDVGGRRKRHMLDEWMSGAEIEYTLLDIAPEEQGEHVIKSDITACPEIPAARFDIVYSDNVLEHVEAPWLAAAEIGRILKPGGLCLIRAPFAWRYHPSPSDYWRFTHSGLELLFEKQAGLETLESGYDIGARRSGTLGGKVPGNLDGVPIDGYGGWLETWLTYYVGRKPQKHSS